MTDISTAMKAAFDDKDAPKPKRKPPTFRRTVPIAVKQLADAHGTAKAADMLGLSDGGLQIMIRNEDVSETVEKLAELIILNGGQTLQRQKHHLIIAKVPQKHAGVVNTFLNALGIKSRDISDDH